jgi:amino acid transporter
VGFVFSLLFRLGEVISAILAMRILVQFVGQAVGLVLLRRRRGTASLPFRMPLYPLPVILAVATWLAVFWGIAPAEVTWFGVTFKLYFQLAALGMMAVGTLAFLLWSRRLARWPFSPTQPR